MAVAAPAAVLAIGWRPHSFAPYAPASADNFEQNDRDLSNSSSLFRVLEDSGKQVAGNPAGIAAGSGNYC